MYTSDENNKLAKHSVSEVVVFNRYLQNLSEVRQLSNGRSWQRFSLSDVSRIADHFAYEALELSLAGHYQGTDFVDKGTSFESLHKGDSGVWKLSDFQGGTYFLSILSSDAGSEGGKLFVTYKKDSKEDFKEPSPLVFNHGIAFYGLIELNKENPTLEIKIINGDEKKLVVEKIQLEPIYYVQGRININTAKREVLNSIFLSNALTETVLNNRPLGVRGEKKLGIGDLFLLNENFLPFHSYLTVRSDVYEINCLGEYVLNNKAVSHQTIRTVVERGNN
jgi:hypothetical protein